MSRPEDLVNEISQIMQQYRREVPANRSRIPVSVKERVFALLDLGVNSSEVSRRTGLPYFTVHGWKKKRGFERLSITDGKGGGGLIAKAATVTVPKPRKRRIATVTVAKSPTVSIVTPSGIRIEGVSAEFLVKILPALGGQQ